MHVVWRWGLVRSRKTQRGRVARMMEEMDYRRDRRGRWDEEENGGESDWSDEDIASGQARAAGDLVRRTKSSALAMQSAVPE
jgi:hypothetical protein